MGRLAIFNDIKTKLLADVSELQTVRLFNNQFDSEDVENAFNYPAVFIEIANIEYDNGQGLLQKANYTFTLHCGFYSLDTEDTTVLTTIDNIHAAVHGLEGQDYTPLKLVGASPDNNHNQVIVETMTFECLEHIELAGTDKDYVQLSPQPTLDLTTQVDVDNDTLKIGDGDFS